MNDLVFPEPERTRTILSAMINFVRFAEEREVFHKKLRDESAGAIEERDRVAEQVAELKERIAVIEYVFCSP